MTQTLGFLTVKGFSVPKRRATWDLPRYTVSIVQRRTGGTGGHPIPAEGQLVSALFDFSFPWGLERGIKRICYLCLDFSWLSSSPLRGQLIITDWGLRYHSRHRYVGTL